MTRILVQNEPDGFNGVFFGFFTFFGVAVWITSLQPPVSFWEGAGEICCSIVVAVLVGIVVAYVAGERYVDIPDKEKR